jgi:short-subunit dehydrogenase
MSLPSRARPVMLVTGASAGIGAALAREYAGRGWDLVLTARRAGPLEALAQDLAQQGAAATVLTDDLADPEAPARLVAALGECVDELGLLHLFKQDGQTVVEGQGLLDEPAWHWPGRG